jgi:hypothetical protein
MRASSFQSKKDGLAKWLHTQLDLFDHNVIPHDVTAIRLCTRRAPKARCMMSTTPQEWHEYNLAQTTEKSRFQELLYALCSGIEEPPAQATGRPRIPLADMLFAIVLKVYCGFSSRRTTSDLMEAQRRGYLARTPHFNSLSNYMEAEWLTAYLHALITQSSLPLKTIERDFAVDSSGFSTNTYSRWVEVKWVESNRGTIELMLRTISSKFG